MSSSLLLAHEVLRLHLEAFYDSQERPVSQSGAGAILQSSDKQCTGLRYWLAELSSRTHDRLPSACGSKLGVLINTQPNPRSAHRRQSLHTGLNDQGRVPAADGMRRPNLVQAGW
jgi:hypothetical protein